MTRTNLSGYLNETRAVICDLDNTLYDFPRFYQAGLSGVLPEIYSLTGMSHEEVLAALRNVYTERRSIEYPFVFEEIPGISDREPVGRRHTALSLMHRFWDTASAALQAYPSVHETLSCLKSADIQIVALTDAPFHEAARRVSYLGLDRYMSGFLALRWFRARSPRSVLRLRDLPGLATVPERFTIARQLPLNMKKPNPEAYAIIADSLGIPVQNFVVVGDSLHRDLNPAIQCGMRPVWARYGMRDTSKEELLMKVVPERLPEVAAVMQPVQDEVIAIDTFADLVPNLVCQQMII